MNNEIYSQALLPLTGNELVTIRQSQNGNLALCTMTVAQFASVVNSANFTANFISWMQSLPTTLPSSPGVAWNNGGVPSLS